MCNYPNTVGETAIIGAKTSNKRQDALYCSISLDCLLKVRI